MTDAVAPGERVLVALATRNRPAGLARTLESLAAQEPCRLPVHVVVVDNDAGGSARPVVDQYATQHDTGGAPLTVSYVCEPRPGIAFARNAALEFVTTCDVVAFLDDDEVADPGWLRLLLDAMVQFDADVTTGPCDRDLPINAPKWAHVSSLFTAEHYPTGTERPVAFTGNAAVRGAAIVEHGLRFAIDHPQMGGTDHWFFAALVEHGARIVWVDEARVTEAVTADRLRLRWAWRRGFRIGYSLVVRDPNRPVGRRARVRAMGAASSELVRAMARTLVGARLGWTVAVDRSVASARAVGALWALCSGRFSGDYN